MLSTLLTERFSSGTFETFVDKLETALGHIEADGKEKYIKLIVLDPPQLRKSERTVQILNPPINQLSYMCNEHTVLAVAIRQETDVRVFF